MAGKPILSIMADVGNTNINIGLFKDRELVDTFVQPTHAPHTSFDALIDSFGAFIDKNAEFKHADGGLISSVVPSITRLVQIYLKHVTGIDAKILDLSMVKDLKMEIDNPNEVGGDLLASIVAGKELYGYPLAIVDVGTVTKILAVDNKGSFVGASFYPGLRSAFYSMSSDTELLPPISETGVSVNDDVPPFPFGKNTIDCMRSGIYWATISSLKDLSQQYRNALGSDTKRIITGGYTDFLSNGIKNEDFIVDKNLVIKGLNIIYLKNN